MSYKKGLFGLGMFILCFGMVSAKTVKVDCFKGKSINTALNANQNVEELIIEIDGICNEAVIVQRDNVTLIGVNVVGGVPTDGIDAASTGSGPPAFGVSLWIRNAANVTVEDLILKGGKRHGLRVTYSRPLIFVENCILEGNDQRGMFVVQAHVELRDTTFTANGLGGAVVTRSRVRCTDCTIDGNPVAVVATDDASVILRDSEVSGSFRARRKSLIQLEGTEQMSHSDENTFGNDSQFQADNDSKVFGPSEFGIFSTGFLESAGGGDVATHSGDIECRSISDVFCPDPASIIDGGVTVGCASCIVVP